VGVFSEHSVESMRVNRNSWPMLAIKLHILRWLWVTFLLQLLQASRWPISSTGGCSDIKTHWRTQREKKDMHFLIRSGLKSNLDDLIQIKSTAKLGLFEIF